MDDKEFETKGKELIDVFKLARKVSAEMEEQRLAVKNAIAGSLLEAARPSPAMLKFLITSGAMLVASGRMISDFYAMSSVALEGAMHSISAFKDAQGALKHEQVVALTTDWKTAFGTDVFPPPAESKPDTEHTRGRKHKGEATKLEEVGFVRRQRHG